MNEVPERLQDVINRMATVYSEEKPHLAKAHDDCQCAHTRMHEFAQMQAFYDGAAWMWHRMVGAIEKFNEEKTQ